jgi:hypothetical protein
VTTASEILLDALVDINALAPGQNLPANNAAVALRKLNDLIDSLSTDEDFVYCTVENIFSWTPGQFKYTVGNPIGGTFAGLVTSGIAAIVGVTLPSTLVVGATITDPSPGTGVIQLNTLVTSIVSVNGGNATAITFTGAPTGSAGTLTAGWGFATGIYQITFSDGEQRAATLTSASTAVTWTPALTGAPTTAASVNPNTVNLSIAPTGTLNDTLTYTIPGNINIGRPLRINSGYTRLTASGNNNLDYWFECTMSMERYNEFGLKFNPGPWPLVLAYQPTFPLGTFWVYPNPNITGEVHLFTDLIFTEFSTLTTNVNFPQGYTRALKKLTSLELAPSWGKAISPQLARQAAEARAFIKRLNASPVVTLRYDSDIVKSQQNDAGWIVRGGF